jgi:signal transduction histidine kinase/CheY-like chemotaxis protein
VLLTQIDTISKLIEENILIWNRMLYLYHSDSLDVFIRELTAQVAVGMLDKKNTEKKILRRVFGKKPEASPDQQAIIRDLSKIEEQDSIQNTRMLAAESRLASTSTEIRRRLYLLISDMEGEVIDAINNNAATADKLAMNTYRWLAMFALLGTLLVILVLVLVVRFVRKTRDYQIALIQSKEETEKLAKTRELFMANMSHEIRTPVNAIYGFSEQLLHESFDEKNRKIVDVIKSSADHLVKMVNDVLDFSKLQNARIILDKVHFQINQVCEEVQLLFGKKASENNTKLHYVLSKSVPLVLFGDPYRLKQILFNLVGNAVKFTAHGEIQFTVDCENKSGNNLVLVLKVSDTGIGIPEDMQEKIFDDFTQAEPETTRKYGGTGLGLSIVKKLVELHKGSISVKSQKNKGTVITCRIPYAIGEWEKLAVSPPEWVVPEYVQQLNILIVDDEEYNRMLFRTILSRWHVNFEEAGDGQKAIEMVKTTAYDLVFMDVRMPVLDGLKATSHIRKILGKDPDELPVIGITATHSPKELQEFKFSGMNTFLPKPFTEKMLLDVILSQCKKDKESGIKEVPAANDYPAGKAKVNLDNLYHLANHDTAFVKQMLIRFIETTEQGLQEIQQAIMAENFEAAMEAAHKISAPCRHLGADELYSQLKMMEDHAKNHKNMSILVKLYENTIREFTDITNLLKGHIVKIDA